MEVEAGLLSLESFLFSRSPFLLEVSSVLGEEPTPKQALLRTPAAPSRALAAREVPPPPQPPGASHSASAMQEPLLPDAAPATLGLQEEWLGASVRRECQGPEPAKLTLAVRAAVRFCV